MEWLFWIPALISAGLAMFLMEIVKKIWLKPLHHKKYFESQGIRGPPYKLFYGNAPDIVRLARKESSQPLPLSEHNIVPRILPAYHHWVEKYGREFVFWFGTKPRLYVTHPEFAKEILCNKFGHCNKLQNKQLGKPGIGRLNGEKWAQHRRIINPAFHTDLLKGMIPSIVQCGNNMLTEWSKMVSSGANEIEVFKEFCILTSDIISRTAFGSSYAEGKHIFHLLDQQLLLFFEVLRSVHIPCFRFLPTKKNRQRWALEKEIKKCIMQVIESKERSAIENSGDYGTDLLGVMMNSNKEEGRGKAQRNMSMATDEIIADCKNFYVAGQETTAILLTWTMVLLGMHPEWQERARNEVLEKCGKNDFPNAETVNGLKIVGMILNESLRLYPPLLILTRETSKPMMLGRLSVPAGTQLEIPILQIHHDQALWGNSVNEFNPERFDQGISKAGKHPLAFMPFSMGPRTCIGQNFGLMEAKIILAMILQRFSFEISPNYIHAPVQSLLLKPQHGAQVILRMK